MSPPESEPHHLLSDNLQPLERLTLQEAARAVFFAAARHKHNLHVEIDTYELRAGSVEVWRVDEEHFVGLVYWEMDDMRGHGDLGACRKQW